MMRALEMKYFEQSNYALTSKIKSLFIFLLLSIFALPVTAEAQQRRTAAQSNLVATNAYQAQATLNAYKRQAGAKINGLRAEAEAARSQVKRIKNQLRKATGQNSPLLRDLRKAEQLAQRDAEYARERKRIITIASSFIKTDAGRRFLELKNEGSPEAWEKAKTIADEELLAQLYMVAENYRNVATQYLDQRDKGLETTSVVISRYEGVIKLDDTHHRDWIELANLYQDAGDLNKALEAAQHSLKLI